MVLEQGRGDYSFRGEGLGLGNYFMDRRIGMVFIPFSLDMVLTMTIQLRGMNGSGCFFDCINLLKKESFG